MVPSLNENAVHNVKRRGMKESERHVLWSVPKRTAGLYIMLLCVQLGVGMFIEGKGLGDIPSGFEQRISWGTLLWAKLSSIVLTSVAMSVLVIEVPRVLWELPRFLWELVLTVALNTKRTGAKVFSRARRFKMVLGGWMKEWREGKERDRKLKAQQRPSEARESPTPPSPTAEYSPPLVLHGEEVAPKRSYPDEPVVS